MAYWNEEVPEVIRTEKNEFRIYPTACKIQVFPVVPNAPRGIGKGAVIDLEVMSEGDLNKFEDLITVAIEGMRERLG